MARLTGRGARETCRVKASSSPFGGVSRVDPVLVRHLQSRLLWRRYGSFIGYIVVTLALVLWVSSLLVAGSARGGHMSIALATSSWRRSVRRCSRVLRRLLRLERTSRPPSYIGIRGLKPRVRSSRIHSADLVRAARALARGPAASVDSGQGLRAHRSANHLRRRLLGPRARGVLALSSALGRGRRHVSA